MTTSAAIEVRDLTVAYRDRPVLWDVDLEVPRGSRMAILGPNGAGKSTLLKAIVGLVRPAAGQVRILGRPLDQVRRQVAYVPQKSTVDWDFPIQVRDVVVMGRYGALGLFRNPSREDLDRASRALEQVGMVGFADRQIRELSGGQQQRVFLARALVQDAEVLLMDEPFQGVDARTEKAIVALLKDLQRQGRTVLLVHHDLQTVRDYFDHVALIHVRRIASGPVEEVFHEANLRAAFGGRIAVFPRDREADPGGKG